MPAAAAEPTGVVFPEVDGRRSTERDRPGRRRRRAAPGRPGRGGRRRSARRTGAAATSPHFRRLVEAGLARPEDAVAIADAGLASVYDRMRWRDPDGREVRLEAALGGVAGSPADLLTTEALGGDGEPDTALTIPYRGRRLGR